jgi:hypothetical protein
LGKTQKQMARLLGISIRTIQSYEQGLRKIPVHTERQSPTASCPEAIPYAWKSALLAGQKMPHEDSKGLPGMGVRGGASLLVHQRNDLPGPAAEKLAKEDGYLQKL